MEVTCPACGATLAVNKNLGGAVIPCPACGESVPVKAAPAPPKTRRRKLELEPDPAPPPRPRARKPRPPRGSLWLVGAQAALAALGISCLLGAFLRTSWAPPSWSYFGEDPMLLVVAGVAILVAAGVARTKPVLVTLLTGVAVLGLCMLRPIDASRTLALATAMLALWLALQHRRRAR